MIIVMKPAASKSQVESICKAVEDLGYKTHVMEGVERTVIGCLGDERGKARLKDFVSKDGVEKVMPILSPFKLASSEMQPEKSVVKVAEGFEFGGKNIPVMAGPCSVESEAQILESARIVKAAGANALRGGAYKPRSSTYSFQGLGEEGLKLLAKAREETGLPIVTEVMDQYTVDLVAEYADMLQIGARNMQNFALLKAVGKTKTPVLLKRGMSATAEELLMSAEYVLAEGNSDVVLCERGIRTFETATRNTLDLNLLPVIRSKSHLPVVVDPSHGTGVATFVETMAKASIAAGCDGLMVEVHPKPEEALSDGPQSLRPEVFESFMSEVKKVAVAMDRSFGA